MRLLFASPGAPVLVYGEEIGMGDDLGLPGRDAVRLPMQWSDGKNGGFSDAPRELVRAPLEKGPYSYKKVNVASQLEDPHSLLRCVRELIRLRRSHEAIGAKALPTAHKLGDKALDCTIERRASTAPPTSSRRKRSA